MVFLSDIIALDELERDIADGFIQRRTHPDFPDLRIVGYTEKAQYAKHWTTATTRARGLIYDQSTGVVLARPFAKFFNFAEHPAGTFDLDAPLVGAFDKADGSLGIGYVRPDGALAIATRGSFESDQALHATAKVAEVAHLFLPGKTPLFEVVYADNRIVVDYGDRDELIHLGWVDITTGAYEAPATLTSHARTLRDVLALAPRPNAEGLVAWVDPFTAVKFKQDDYLALHRVVFGLSAKEVWRNLSAGTYDDFVTMLPDEFHGAVTGIADELRARYDEHVHRAHGDVAAVTAQGFGTQKERALWLQAHTTQPATGFAFSLLAGRGIEEGIWRVLEPKGAGMTLEPAVPAVTGARA